MNSILSGFRAAVIPPWFKWAALATMLAASFFAGAAVNGWRLDGDHQRAMNAKQQAYDGLYDRLREQNHAVDAMKAASDAADERRKLAERYAAGVLARLDDRSAAVAGSKAHDCGGVLREAWGAGR